MTNYRIALDLGDGRTRTGFRLAITHRRLPALFPVSAAPEGSTVEFHTSLPNAASLQHPVRRGSTITHVSMPELLPNRWSFACVLRRKGGPGTVVEGIFRQGKPLLLGSRTVAAKDLTADALRRHLRLRIGQ